MRTFGLGAGADVRADQVESLGVAGTAFMLHTPWGRRRMRSATPGRHLVPHALAAAAVAERFGVPLDEVEAALAAGSRAAHRMAVVEAASGATLIDDTYNASPVSVGAALDFLAETPIDPGRGRYAVLGDMLELGPDEERLHREIGTRAAGVVDALLAVGPRGRWIADAATAAGLRRVATAGDVDEAMAAFDRAIVAGPGDVVLVKGSRGVELDRLVAALQAGPRRLISIVLALLLAFVGVVLLGPVYIGLLQRLGFGKRIRTDGPEGHLVKAGTPTMGGMLVVLVVMFLAMAMRIEDSVTLTPMLALVGVGILGAIDDFVNVRSGVGMRGRWKLVWQTIVALLAAFYVQRHFNITVLNIPFLGEFVVGGIFFALFMAFVIVGVSNAVNLTDGLDGLAAGVLIFSFVAYLLIALVDPPGRRGPQPNLAVFCALVIGALMGFLWFNVHPAQIFMGDSGSLGLGATLAVVATLSRQLPLLAIIGVVFFAVIMSVVLQVISFRMRGRRIFRMAPLQHHFELIGWAEEKITVRFWIVSALAGLLGFSLFLASTTGLQ